MRHAEGDAVPLSLIRQAPALPLPSELGSCESCKPAEMQLREGRHFRALCALGLLWVTCLKLERPFGEGACSADPFSGNSRLISLVSESAPTAFQPRIPLQV